jgi:hypothetical protein
MLAAAAVESFTGRERPCDQQVLDVVGAKGVDGGLDGPPNHEARGEGGEQG